MLCPNCHTDGISTSCEVCPHCGVYIPSVMRDMLAIGTILRQETYRIDGILGRGGFGVTYQGFHLKLAKPVAIKEYYPQDFAIRNPSNGELKVRTTYEQVYQRNQERFIGEGRILANLHHDNIVRVHDLFEERGTAYLVMDLLSGRTLRQELDAQPEKKLSRTQIKKIMEPLVDGLDTVHQAGVFHLDLKPENIILLPDNQVVLLDFGAARLGMSKNSTQPFTAEYAAPEVIAGNDVSASSDIFELGMILYEMLTGELPPSALSRLINDTWQPINLEEPWQSLLYQALQISLDSRPQNVRQWWGKKPIKDKWWPSIETILPNATPEKSKSSASSAMDIKSQVEKEDKPERFTTNTPIDNFTLLPPSTSSSYLEDGVIVVGSRAIGKTSTVVSLAKGTKLVKFTDSGKHVIARRSNPATGKVAATATMTPETLSVNVELASGEKQIQFLWVDTPGEAFSNSQWLKNNQSDWQDIQATISHSKAVILLIPPYQELVAPNRIDARTVVNDLPLYKEWLQGLENWLNFFRLNCQKVEHILICLHRADTFCDVKSEAKKWRFDSKQGPFFFKYENYIRNTYFTPALSIIRAYNSQHPQATLHFFITTIDEPGLLELPWIYLASFLENNHG